MAAWSRAYIAAAVDGIITIDQRGTVRSFNPAAERLFGWSEAEVLGRNVSVLMPDPYRREHDGYLAAYRRSGKPRIIGVGREVTGIRRDGTTFPAHLSVCEVATAEGLLFAGTVRDLSDLRRAEGEASRARTLAAIGEMSASIAHEIKNPLASISAVLQNLRSREEASSATRALMDEALGQVRRLDARVHDLLLFSRSWNPRPRPVDLRAIVERVVAATEGVALYAGVRFRVDAPPGVPLVADRSMLEQVFLNLFQNSAEAMEGREGTIRCVIEQSPSGITAAIEDDGPGIPPDTRETLFRPFFTTKKGGTGLGLANCLKMMEAHGGTISVEPGSPRGTRIELRFPRAIEATTPSGEGA
jgi:two-component system sensor kinase FixL